MRSNPFIIVLSGPSGAGKTSIARRVVGRSEDLHFAISSTTRRPREGESEGVDYIFLSEAEFQRRLEAGEFLEWAEVHGHKYGTPRQEVEGPLGDGHHVVLDVDVQGGAQLRKQYPSGLFIFLLPPSVEALKDRLQQRGTEGERELRRRLLQAAREMEVVDQYDFVVINEDLREAVRVIETIIRTEEHRRERLKGLGAWLGRLIAEVRSEAEMAGRSDIGATRR